MKLILVAVLVVLFAPASAGAQNDCGHGPDVFPGKKAPPTNGHWERCKPAAPAAPPVPLPPVLPRTVVPPPPIPSAAPIIEAAPKAAGAVQDVIATAARHVEKATRPVRRRVRPEPPPPGTFTPSPEDGFPEGLALLAALAFGLAIATPMACSPVGPRPGVR